MTPHNWDKISKPIGFSRGEIIDLSSSQHNHQCTRCGTRVFIGKDRIIYQLSIRDDYIEDCDEVIIKQLHES